jgi:uncharacterized membrane protein
LVFISCFVRGQRRDVPWSGKILLGSLLAGFGLFNWSKALSTTKFSAFTTSWNTADNKLPYDLAFLASGVILLLVGGM